MSARDGDDDDGSRGRPPTGPSVAVFQRGTFAPVERGTGSVSIVPAQGPASVEPAEPRAPDDAAVDTARERTPGASAIAHEPASARPSAPTSEPPAKDVLRATLLRDFHDKLEALEQLYTTLATVNHYVALGVRTTASPKAIRHAYSEVTKRFHLDVYFRQNVGEHQDKLEAVVSALTFAYETLRRPRTRAEYDASIGLPLAERYFVTAADGSLVPNAFDAERDSAAHHFNAIVPPGPQATASANAERTTARAPSVRPPSRASAQSMGPKPAQRSLASPAQPSRASMPPRTSPLTDTHASMRPRERASAGRHAEREAFTDDEPKTSSAPFSSQTGSGSTRNPFASPAGTSPSLRPSFPVERTGRGSIPIAPTIGQEPAQKREGADLVADETTPLPSLLDLAHQRRFGGGLSTWTAARLRDAHQAEAVGLALEAANILRSVLNQVSDKHIAAHVARLERLANGA